MEITIPVYEDEPAVTKTTSRGKRILKSQFARLRRRKTKNVIETRVMNRWAKAHRAKKKK